MANVFISYSSKSKDKVQGLAQDLETAGYQIWFDRKLRDQHKELCLKLNGYYGYFGIVGNYKSLARYMRAVVGIWRKWLNRRSRRRDLYWYKMWKILETFPLPQPRIVHSTG